MIRPDPRQGSIKANMKINLRFSMSIATGYWMGHRNSLFFQRRGVSKNVFHALSKWHSLDPFDNQLEDFVLTFEDPARF